MAFESNDSPKPARICSNCGSKMSPAGRRPKRDIGSFCMKPACRSARAKAARAWDKRFYEHPEEAPRICAACMNPNDPLPARKWRSGDEFGRYHDTAACRMRRDEARASVNGKAELITEIERLRVVISFLQAALNADAPDNPLFNRVVCKVCGCTSAIPGWVHPNAIEQPCHGTLDGMPPRKFGMEGLIGAWPTQRQYIDVSVYDE